VMVRNKWPYLDTESDSETSRVTTLKRKYVTTGHRKYDSNHVSANGENFTKKSQKALKTPDNGTLIRSDPQLMPAYKPSPHKHMPRLIVSSSGRQDNCHSPMDSSKVCVSSQLRKRKHGRRQKTDQTRKNTVSPRPTLSYGEQRLRN